LKENEDNENICPPTSQPATIRWILTQSSKLQK
jgi:hypothetical protein